MSVLLIDGSIGFGGATKSASLILREMSDLPAVVMSSQEPYVLETWFRGQTVVPHRRLLNYRTRWEVGHLSAKLRTRWAKVVGLRAYGWAERLALPALVWRIVRLCRKHKTELIHLQNGFAPEEAFIAARLLRIPVLVHLRGFAGSEVPRTFGAEVMVVGDSRAVVDSLPAGLDIHHPSRIIYEPVDVDSFDRTLSRGPRIRARLGIAEDEVAIGSFGRIMRWKGQVEFVRAVLRARERCPNVKGVVVGAAGDAGEAYQKEVLGLVRDAGAEDAFVFTGYVAEPEPYYHAMDMVVHSAIKPEPCGMVVLEGMAASKAVIAAAAGGPMETVAHGHDGLLVPPGDVEGLASALVWLAGDRGARLRLGQQARRTAEFRFSTQVAAKEVADAYRNLGVAIDAEPVASLATSPLPPEVSTS